jgi:hypothetical protein
VAVAVTSPDDISGHPAPAYPFLPMIETLLQAGDREALSAAIVLAVRFA